MLTCVVTYKQTNSNAVASITRNCAKTCDTHTNYAHSHYHSRTTSGCLGASILLPFSNCYHFPVMLVPHHKYVIVDLISTAHDSPTYTHTHALHIMPCTGTTVVRRSHKRIRHVCFVLFLLFFSECSLCTVLCVNV